MIQADMTITSSDQAELNAIADEVRAACTGVVLTEVEPDESRWSLRIIVYEIAELAPCFQVLGVHLRRWWEALPPDDQVANLDVRHQEGEERPWHLSLTL